MLLYLPLTAVGFCNHGAQPNKQKGTASASTCRLSNMHGHTARRVRTTFCVFPSRSFYHCVIICWLSKKADILAAPPPRSPSNPFKWSISSFRKVPEEPHNHTVKPGDRNVMNSDLCSNDSGVGVISTTGCFLSNQHHPAGWASAGSCTAGPGTQKCVLLTVESRMFSTAAVLMSKHVSLLLCCRLLVLLFVFKLYIYILVIISALNINLCPKSVLFHFNCQSITILILYSPDELSFSE